MLAKVARAKQSEHSAKGMCPECYMYAGHAILCPTRRFVAEPDVTPVEGQIIVKASNASNELIVTLGLLTCPTCDGELTCLHNPSGEVKFYTCQDLPTKHRWAYYYKR